MEDVGHELIFERQVTVMVTQSIPLGVRFKAYKWREMGIYTERWIRGHGQ